MLGRFSPKDREAMDEAAARAADAIRSIIAEGPDAAMNQFNTVKKPAKDPKKSKELKKQGKMPDRKELHVLAVGLGNPR